MLFQITVTKFNFILNYKVNVDNFVKVSMMNRNITHVIGARNEMIDDFDGQIIFGNLMGLKLPDIRLTHEEKPRKNFIHEICPDRGSNPGPLRDNRACYRLFHSGGQREKDTFPYQIGPSLIKWYRNSQHNLTLSIPYHRTSLYSTSYSVSFS